ncbi:DUF3427 domain-containing protein [Psychrobacillus sp. BL-248-WT-3]|uniref:DUF3427 domain-containing protein n=1 Tax=Psychrobacillus sp. BL-248-WT-3 TaxID=2725306 RepID=UPI00146F3F07|nr:DUF3427 domain-containing protein [Psychrobacillus sp. BL-248-WT-3]NME06233.1 DUF3427 domain-containing protein [Psychrobacillus sp. BL-248-WT-3]
MRTLKLFNKYTREDVHAIFDGSTTKFTRGAGVWGLHGIVKIPNRERDFVFFVTIGQDKLGVEFKENITRDGILTWQSQKRHTLNHPRILEFIHHDHTRHNIYLFLRTSKKSEPFTYMGRLAYIAHNQDVEQPVHFKWQLLDWDEEEPVQDLMLDTTEEDVVDEEIIGNQLIETALPEPKERRERVRNFNSKHVDFVGKQKENKNLGLSGELLVLEYTRSQLTKAGRQDLANKVIHKSVVEGDGAGYDIESFKEDGSPLYLEVKTTKGGINSEFFISPNELAFSEEHADSFQLIRVYEYISNINSGKFYKIEGSLSDKLNLKPTQYSARV